jgi:hypothetical protein
VGNLTYCTVGSKASGGERVEVFAQGVGAFTEDFKQLTLKTGSISTSKKYFADKGYDEQLASFIASIRKGAPPAVTVLDGVRSTIGCLRMIESAKENTTLDFGLDALLSGKPEMVSSK